MSDAIRHVTITGRVQGVGYRAWVDYEARAHLFYNIFIVIHFGEDIPLRGHAVG